MDVFQPWFLNFLIAFANAFLMVFHTSRANKHRETIDLTGYRLTFEDDFNGDRLDPEKWDAHEFYGVRKGGWWSGSQARVEDGNLIITTSYKEDGEFGPGWYTCGLSTQHKFEQAYGYFECRAVLPKGQGLWSAFWMMNDNVHKITKKAYQGAELDIMESPFWHLKGKKRNRKITQNIHYSGYNLETKYHNIGIFKLDNDPYEEFNTYGLLWTPDAYEFYINGQKVARSTYGGVSTQPEYLILSCEVDGGDSKPTFGWSGNIEKNDKATFKAEYKVDYVRAYSLPEPRA